MKASELRIGNWIRNKHQLVEILAIISTDDLFVKTEYEDWYPLLKDCEPIPLTEEWIERCGFPEDKSTMDLLFDYLICLERQGNELYLINTQDKYQYKIETVHYLQNLVYTLKGEKLTIKEKPLTNSEGLSN